MQGIFEYFNLLFSAIGYALRLDPAVYSAAITHPRSTEVILGIVFLAGVSTLLGQSVVLFINRVRRGRFIFSMILNGFIFIISYTIWGIAIGVVGRFMFPVSPDPWSMVRLVGLSTAPLVFGFLILIPYMGTAIGKLLSVWELLIMTTVVQFEFQAEFMAAAVCVGLSWLLMLLLTNTLGKPVVKLRNYIWRKVTGSDLDTTPQDILLEFSGGQGLATDAQNGGHS